MGGKPSGGIDDPHVAFDVCGGLVRGHGIDVPGLRPERPVDPAFGNDVLKMVQAALNQTPETIALLKEAMSAKGNPK